MPKAAYWWFALIFLFATDCSAFKQPACSKFTDLAGTKKFKCGSCPFRSNLKSAIVYHLKAKHSIDTPEMDHIVVMSPEEAASSLLAYERKHPQSRRVRRAKHWVNLVVNKRLFLKFQTLSFICCFVVVVILLLLDVDQASFKCAITIISLCLTFKAIVFLILFFV